MPYRSLAEYRHARALWLSLTPRERVEFLRRLSVVEA